MPHHPSCCGIEKEAIPWADVALEDVLLFVLDEGPERGMNYTFWFACCAGAVEDVNRVTRW